MAQENQKITKTYVGGSFLYSQDGVGYEEGHKEHRENQQKIIQDKLGLQQYHQELREKKMEAMNKKKATQANKILQKPVLIPIRDTPVEPVPQPVLQNQKCQRATQEQFEYFQSYISQKQKERKFEEEEDRQLLIFQQNQKKYKEREIKEEQREQVGIIMEKEEEVKKPKGKKNAIKIKIKKKVEGEEGEKLPSKVRIVDT